MDESGNFTITWSGSGLGDSGYGTFAQRYNISGATQGTNFLVNNYTLGNQVETSITMDSSGNFVITWYGPGTGDTTSGIFKQRYNSSGEIQ